MTDLGPPTPEQGDTGTTLVTGATGFVGSHVVRRLSMGGIRFRALVRRPEQAAWIERLGGTPHIADLTRPASLRGVARDVDVIYHCAGKVDLWGSRDAFIGTNADGLSALLEQCSGGRQRFVHLSSASVHREPLPTEIHEDHALTASRHPYLASKVEAERRLMTAHDDGVVSATVLRPVHIYGPRSQLVIETVRRIRSGRRTLISFSGGTLPIVYVQNLVDAMLLAGTRPEAVGEAFFVTDDVLIDWNGFVRGLAHHANLRLNPGLLSPWAAELTGAALELAYAAAGIRSRPPVTRAAIRMLSVPGRFSVSKATERLDYRPRYGLREALTETARWIEASHEAGSAGGSDLPEHEPGVDPLA